jgi:hypothetical protein
MSVERQAIELRCREEAAGELHTILLLKSSACHCDFDRRLEREQLFGLILQEREQPFVVIGECCYRAFFLCFFRRIIRSYWNCATRKAEKPQQDDSLSDCHIKHAQDHHRQVTTQRSLGVALGVPPTKHDWLPFCSVVRTPPLGKMRHAFLPAMWALIATDVPPTPM